MKSNFDDAFSLMLRSEGFGVRKDNPYGFSNHPRDPGGATQLGVTQRAWEDWVGHPVTIDDMKGLRPETVKPFYKAKYWDAISADGLPDGIDYAAFDLSVNSGASRAARYLQSIAGVATDGVIGPVTLAAIAKKKPKEVIRELCAMRMNFLKRLPTWGDFGLGWSRRVAEVEIRAAKMANTA
jgi:lysozyme family protein